MGGTCVIPGRDVSRTCGFSWETVLVEDNIKLYSEKQGVKF